MDQLPSNPILKFNPNQLYEVRKLFGQEDQEKFNQAIDQLEDWIKKQNHFTVTVFDRGFLERLIIYSKGSIERSKQRLDKICTLRKLSPEFMDNVDVKNEFHDFLEYTHTCLLPNPTNDNCRAVFCSLNVVNHPGFNILSIYRYFIAISQYCHYHDYPASTVSIFDVRDFSLTILGKLYPTVFQKGYTIMREAFAFRMKAFHIICDSKFVDVALTFYRQLFGAKLAKRIHIHTSYESLHKHVDKSILPVDIGGEYEKTCKELSDDLFKELCSDSNIATIKFMETAITDESRRLTSTFNEQYSGMPGSFRTLCVD